MGDHWPKQPGDVVAAIMAAAELAANSGPQPMGNWTAEVDDNDVVCLKCDGSPRVYMPLDAYLKFRESDAHRTTEQADG